MKSVLALAAILSLSGCATSDLIYGPEDKHVPDAQTNCIENHTWGETVNGSAGPKLVQCSGIGWYVEERKRAGTWPLINKYK